MPYGNPPSIVKKECKNLHIFFKTINFIYNHEEITTKCILMHYKLYNNGSVADRLFVSGRGGMWHVC